MAISNDQKLDKLFKKSLQKGDDSTNRDFFVENNSTNFVTSDNVWIETIPKPLSDFFSSNDFNGAIDGVVQRIKGIVLKPVPLSDFAYAPDNPTDLERLIGIIPFVYDISYLPTIKDGAGDVLNFGAGSWLFDWGAGVLRFYDPTHISFTSLDSSEFVIDFYKYIGKKGFEELSSGIGDLESILAKLTPNTPPSISENPFWNISGFIGDGVDGRTNISDITYATSIGHKVVSDIYDGQEGTLTFSIQKNFFTIFSASEEIADAPISSDDMDISSPVDPYIGQVGQADFFKVVNATLKPSSSLFTCSQNAVNSFAIKLKHTSPDDEISSNIFEIDLPPGSPTMSGLVVTSVTEITRYVSGIPVIREGTKIHFDVIGENLVSNFFNTGWIMRATGNLVNSKDFNSSNFGTINTYGQQLNLNDFVIIASGKYTYSQISITLNGRNVAGNTHSVNAVTGILLVDTKTNESNRLKSGTDLYPLVTPAGECGSVFDPTQSLLINSELMMLNAKVKYPSGDYTAIGGDNYNTISGWRWFTKKFTNKVGSKVYIQFTGAVNFGISPILPDNMKLFVKCEGETQWMSATDAFSPSDPDSTKNSNSDGAKGLLMAESDSDTKTLTFGRVIPDPFTMYIRVGFDTGCDAQFSDFTASTSM